MAVFYGRFSGNPLTRWLSDGREMLVEEDFSFLDPNGIVWLAPRGSKVDGASIPRALWSIVGAPLDGPYRNASIIHDVACVEKAREWQLVHRCFYNAMRTMRAMRSAQAKLMYAAVYHFGPRWTLSSPGPAVIFVPEMTRKDVFYLRKQVRGPRRYTDADIEFAQHATAGLGGMGLGSLYGPEATLGAIEEMVPPTWARVNAEAPRNILWGKNARRKKRP
jgi:Protein of unknown function (DUF1353)